MTHKTKLLEQALMQINDISRDGWARTDGLLREIFSNIGLVAQCALDGEVAEFGESVEVRAMLHDSDGKVVHIR